MHDRRSLETLPLIRRGSAAALGHLDIAHVQQANAGDALGSIFGFTGKPQQPLLMRRKVPLAKTNAVQTKAFLAIPRGGHEFTHQVDGCDLHVTTCD